MSREVRGQYLKNKFKDMSRHSIATFIHDKRFNQDWSWHDIELETGLSEKSMRRLLRQAGLPGASIAKGINIKNAKRNELILTIVKDHAERNELISQQGIADLVTAAGFPVTRGTVNGVIDRAKEHGELTSEYEEVKPIGTKNRKKVNYGFVGPYSGPGKPDGLPARTPELLIKGRVSYDALQQGMCKYTPSEEGPFFFCGEAVTSHRSWCNDCYENIIKRPITEDKAKASRRAFEALAA